MTTNYPEYAVKSVETLIDTILEFAPTTCTRYDIVKSYVVKRLAEKVQYYGDAELKYAISQLPESEQAEYTAKLPENKEKQARKDFTEFSQKPQPVGYTRKCSKCEGTGLYVMWIENGKARSHTGTTCYKCNGRGWTK